MEQITIQEFLSCKHEYMQADIICRDQNEVYTITVCKYCDHEKI